MLRCPVLIVLWILQLLRELQKVLICRPSNRKLTRQHVNMTVHISNYKEKKQSDVHTYIYILYLLQYILDIFADDSNGNGIGMRHWSITDFFEPCIFRLRKHTAFMCRIFS